MQIGVECRFKFEKTYCKRIRCHYVGHVENEKTHLLFDKFDDNIQLQDRINQ